MKFKKIIVFLTGEPASGKDTQASLLAKKLKAKKINVSEVLDEFFKNYKKNYLKIGKRNINIRKERENRFSGKLVSFDLVSYLMKNEIEKNLNSKKSLIVLGGPRSIKEAKTYLSLIKKHKLNYLFIYLKISEEEVFRRALLRKREDNLDVEEKIKIRLEFFKKYTLPAINFLKKREEIKEINGEGSVKEVYQRIWREVKSKLNL
jgi:adenylate kinase